MSATAAASHEHGSARPLLRAAPRGRRLPENLRTTVKVDRRTVIGRDATEFRAALVQHVGGNPTETQKALIEIAVQLRMRLCSFDFRFAEAGEQSDHDSRQYLAWANALSRVVIKIGLQAAFKPKRTLADHLRDQYGMLGGEPAPDRALARAGSAARQTRPSRPSASTAAPGASPDRAGGQARRTLASAG